jgi:hypothetical protein
VERFTLSSSKPFDQVVAALTSAVGHPDMSEFWKSTQRSAISRPRPNEKKLRTRKITNHAQLRPRLFKVAHDYELADFQKAIQHVSCPGKSGIVLLKSPA